ncbi:MAG: outer membrane beta-barrel protein [Bdellovibrio sp.]|nr:outer membrane beta-barrel protein [Bdellovibrio sp.]
MVCAFFLGISSAHAVDVAGVTVNGEVAFDYDFLSPNNEKMAFTGFAPNDTYRLNVTQILAKKETEQISFLARLVYVPTAYVTDATTPPGTKSTSNIGTLDQLEVYYKILPSLSVGFGRFLTTMGYESLFKSENAFYGNSIAYQAIIPGYGEGLRAKYVVGEWLTATVSTYNQSTYNVFGDDYTPTKTTEVSATGMLGPVTWFGGYYFGKDGQLPADRAEHTASSVWASYKIIDDLLVAVTYDSRTTAPDIGTAGGTAGWSDSTSALVTYKLWVNNFGVRYEMVRGAMHLQEAGASVYGSADKVDSLTITDKIALNEHFNVYAEYRTDHADQKVFDNNSNEYADMFTVGAVASF